MFRHDLALARRLRFTALSVLPATCRDGQTGPRCAVQKQKELSMCKTLTESACKQPSTEATASLSLGAELNQNPDRTEELLKKGMDVVDGAMSGKSQVYVQSRRFPGGE